LWEIETSRRIVLAATRFAEFLSMQRRLAILFGFLAVLVAAPGCGPAVAKSDLGNIVYEVPKIPGTEEPFPIPDVVPALAQPEPDL
jgi:hypothetical protein